MKILKKESLNSFLNTVQERYTVFAPKSRDDHTILCQFEKDDIVALSHRGTKNTLKNIFLPPSEELFRFQGTEIKEPEDDDTPWLIFGHHPCDAASLLLLDKVFNDGIYTDPYYVHRRNRSVLFTVACHQSEPSCFCTTVGGSPSAREGSDLIGTFLGDRFVVDIITPKGEKLCGQFPEFFDEAGEEDKNSAEEQAKRVAESIVWKEDLSGLKEKLDGMFEHPIWDRIHLRCLGCGICTFHCPTCFCFDITDETSRDGGRRVRTWDSCMFSRYSRHVSGHNPRPSGKERWRQRFLHKFQQTEERFGSTFCVGCGRCVKNCPVTLDIREVIEEVKKADI